MVLKPSLEHYLTVFENLRKSRIQHCERSYIYILSAKNGPFWRFFWKPEACGQTVLPDKSILIGQKLVKNAKIQMRLFENLKFKVKQRYQTGGKFQKFKWDILNDFQTLCIKRFLVDFSNFRD